MSVIRIMTNFNIELEFPAASFLRRLGAWIIDLVILYFYFLFASNILQWMEMNTIEQVQIIANLVFLIPLLCYHLICETTMNGQSFGKKITGIQVVNENGGQPSIGQFVIRWLIRTSDIMCLVIIFVALAAAARGPNGELLWQIGIPLGLFLTDIILVNLSRKNQRLGDMLAHTLLIKATEKRTIHDTVFQHVSEDYVPSFPQVMQLSDRDINSLKSILDTARKKEDYNLAEMASNKIRNHLGIQTTLPAFDFLEVLLKDYNYLSAN